MSGTFSKLEVMFHRVSQADEAGRKEILDELSATDKALHGRLLALLEAEQQLDDATDLLNAADPERTITDAERQTLIMTEELAAGAALEGAPTLEGFRFLRKLGEGGMGVVWEAQQVKPVRRRVAVKLVRAQGQESGTFLGRFAAEQQAQAMMDHPNIAKVFEAGALLDGRPYFVMELVQGMPITQYCDANSASTEQRLELLSSVCAAVTHAHRRGVVHRDLKPSNVLVHEVDGSASVKVIDFGIAKLLDTEGTGINLETRVQDVVGTPAYMSPEQISPTAAGVDTRADVYSLGVILFELLVGSLPHGAGSGSVAELLELRDKVVSGDTPAPSTRLNASLAEAAQIAERRGTEVADLVRELKGELDWIVLKALHRDLDQRYDSPEALARDIERFLSDLPVEAGPPHWRYKLRKWVQRHRLKAAAVILIAVGLAVGVGGLGWGLAEARSARALAEFRALDAEASRDFLVSLFELSDDSAGRTGELSAIELVRRGAGRLEAGFEQQPQMRATLLRIVAATFRRLGDISAARAAALRSVATWEGLGALDSRTTAEYLEARLEVARAALAAGQTQDAEEQLQTVIASAQHLRGDGDRVAALANADLAEAMRLSGRAQEALEPSLKAVALARKAMGAVHHETAWLTGRLGLIQIAAHQADAAASSWRQAILILEKVRGGLDPALAPHLNNLAAVLRSQGQGAEAEPLLERLVGIDRARYGTTHPLTAASLFLHGESLRLSGRPEDAALALTEALSIQRNGLGSHPSTALTLNELGLASFDLERNEIAETLLREALAMRRALYGDKHPDVADSWSNLADVTRAWDRLSEAEEYGVEALRVARGLLPEGHPQLSLYGLGLSDTYRRAGKLEQARRQLDEARVGLQGLPEGHLLRLLAEVQHCELLIASGDIEAARRAVDPLSKQLESAEAGTAGRAAVASRVLAARAVIEG